MTTNGKSFASVPSGVCVITVTSCPARTNSRASMKETASRPPILGWKEKEERRIFNTAA
jgi:hypothetical protein